jgi:hypothetical protein
MSSEAARIQAVLEGVGLPAPKQKLVEYARAQDPAAVALLERIPDREYRSLDEVGEAIAPVQPQSPPDAELPREESDEPPGGDAYVQPHPLPGAVRPSAPRSNPPQKAIEQQTKTQNEQQERQKAMLGEEQKD